MNKISSNCMLRENNYNKALNIINSIKYLQLIKYDQINLV